MIIFKSTCKYSVLSSTCNPWLEQHPWFPRRFDKRQVLPLMSLSSEKPLVVRASGQTLRAFSCPVPVGSVKPKVCFPGLLNSGYLLSAARSVWSSLDALNASKSSSNLSSPCGHHYASMVLSYQMRKVRCESFLIDETEVAGNRIWFDNTSSTVPIETVACVTCLKLNLKMLCYGSCHAMSMLPFPWRILSPNTYLLDSTLWFHDIENTSYQDKLGHIMTRTLDLDVKVADSVMTSKRLMLPVDTKMAVVSPHSWEFSGFLDKLAVEHSQIVLREAQSQSFSGRQQYTPSAKVHACAGACAGSFVSLCLHPFDTVKTFLQSHGMTHKSAWFVGRSIIAERGVMGLYRGLLTKIASSTPISSIYTCTYESTKAVLATIVPKEYSSLSHCISGGCASVATSFVFTPSEHVKQQMQLMPQYRNSWTALVEITRHGGLPSLYAGLGAVLCRNVPHSIIKEMMTATPQSSPILLNTLQTLTCGGLAGATAALFTTPFDVVKTRLQTQVPGSPTQYKGVFNALEIISKHEGIKGLFRGLVPRLFMYMTQSALFFTSYECAKRILPLAK